MVHALVVVLISVHHANLVFIVWMVSVYRFVQLDILLLVLLVWFVLLIVLLVFHLLTAVAVSLVII